MNIDQLLIQLQLKYKEILEAKSPKVIEKALNVLHKSREKVMKNRSQNFSLDLEGLDEETKEIFELMKQYEKDIKEIFINNNGMICHISDVSPEKMRDGKIKRSKNRENNYQTESGNWAFARTYMEGDEINNPYIARKAETGMIYITSDVYIYGGDNIEVKMEKNGQKRAFLKEPNYLYEINPANFTPVVTLRKNKNGLPYFEFSEEWVSNQDVDINDPNQVKKVIEIKDITRLLGNYQVLCDVNMSREAMKIFFCKNPQEGLKMIIEGIKNGKLRYINGETGKNAINILMVKQKSNEFEIEL